MNSDNTGSTPNFESLFADHMKILAERHDRALEQAGANHCVIYSGNPRIAFLDDYQMPFKPNPHFLAWVPLRNLPFSYIVYSPGETPVLVYYQPHDYWHVVPGAPEGFWVEQFDVRIVHSMEEATALLPQNRDQCVLIGEFDDNSLQFGIERINPTTAINILHLGRGIKTGYELASMRQASSRGAKGHAAAESAFRDGRSEFEIHQAYCHAVSHTDSELPYGNIIALNEHGAVLHYTHLERQPPVELRSFLIDAGAEVNGYASDITRTYSFRDSRFQALIDLMDSMEQDIVSRVSAGVDYRDIHIETHKMIARVLVEAELANGDPDTLLETGVTSAFFPHGIGHLLGIQVHDVGGFMQDESGNTIDPPSGHRFLRLTRILEQDMVLTIEPGLYVIDMLLEKLRGTPAESHVNWATVDWLRPFGGVRIEDDVRVLANDQENLTRDAFARL